MPIYDISLPISDSLVIWPKDPPVRITQPRHFDMGDHAIVSHIEMSAHAGTHLDAPAHFLRDGATLDDLDLELLVGPALLVDAGDARSLTSETLAHLGIPRDTDRLLLRTRNSDLWAEGSIGFHEDFVAITEDGAQWLIERGVRVVGIDYLSVAPYGDTGPTHRALLRAGVIPIEGLNLNGIQPGTYQFVCLPLRLAGAEGAPARAILIT